MNIYKKNDELLSWFGDNYIKAFVKKIEIIDGNEVEIETEIIDDTEIIQIKEIFEAFTQSNYYMNLSKAEKREINKSKFTEKLSTNYFLKKDYKECEQRKIIKDKYKCEKMRNVFVGYKTIDEVE